MQIELTLGNFVFYRKTLLNSVSYCDKELNHIKICSLQSKGPKLKIVVSEDTLTLLSLTLKSNVI